MPLHLVPNELRGYRIKPDWYSYNIVEVKIYGPNSRHHGQEYETPLAYCKNLPFAVSWLLSHALRVQAELNQKEQESVNGSVADARAMLAAFEAAEAHVLAAVAELQQRIDALGLTQKQMVQVLGTAEPEEIHPVESLSPE